MGSLRFDRDQRYLTLREIFRRLEVPDGASCLDVGGGTGELRDLLPHVRFRTLDLRGGGPTHIHGSMQHLPFADGAFDVVLQADALEHVPESIREESLREITRVARCFVIWMCPVQRDLSVAVEEDLCETHRQLFAGREMDWLVEHRALGLPDEAKVRSVLSEPMFDWINWPAASLQRYWFLKRLDLQLDAGMASPQVEQAVNAWYSTAGWKEDYSVLDGSPAYRSIFVGSKSTQLPAGLEIRPDPSGSLLDEWKSLLPLVDCLAPSPPIAANGKIVDTGLSDQLDRIAGILALYQRPAEPSLFGKLLGR